MQLGQTLWEERYSYLPGVVSLIIWFAILFGFLECHRTAVKTVAVCAALLLTFHNLSRWDASPYGYRRPDLHWPEAAASLQKILDQKKEGSLREPAVIENFEWVHPVWWGRNQGKLMMIIPPN